MGERLLCKQEVIGSIPFTSTRLGARLNTADRIYASLVGEFELGPLGLGKRDDRVYRAGMAGIGGRLALFFDLLVERRCWTRLRAVCHCE